MSSSTGFEVRRVGTLGLGLMLMVGAAAGDEPPRCGTGLHMLKPDGSVLGAAPLKHTEVRADIAGFIGRITVRQTFQNPLQQKIEALYVFPLPQDAAVDDMTMIVGGRRIVGQIKERGEARLVYERAKAAGHIASLLDQERPNIFTQSVANIEPGADVVIEISFVEVVKYEDGVYEWAFPMVVGPRYIPGGGSAPAPMTNGQNTPQVPDASKITPPVTPPGTRAGHDINLTVSIDSGSPAGGPTEIASPTHEVVLTPGRGPGCQSVTLKNRSEIPNKDFVLRYRLGGAGIQEGYWVSQTPMGAYFTLILQPPQRVVPNALMPRELIFVLDTSGSMSGLPIEKAKLVMSKAIAAMRPGDTFNMITFAGDTHVLWERPRPATPQNQAEAQKFLAGQRGGGGTEMMKAIDAALVQTRGDGRAQPAMLSAAQLADLPADGRPVTVRLPYDVWTTSQWNRPEGAELPVRPGLNIRVVAGAAVEWGQGVSCPVGEPLLLSGTWDTVAGERVLRVSGARYGDAAAAPIRVCMFLTDGYVGNDFEIIDAVRKNAATTRVFSFGIGSSVNRFLLDGMAHAGRGEVEYVTLGADPNAAAERFAQRIAAPLLTDISINWGDLPISEVFPVQSPDLFAAKPIVIHGKLASTTGGGTITLRGNTGAGPYERTIAVRAPMTASAAPAHAPTTDAEPAIPYSSAVTGAAQDALASLWARSKVAHLMNQDLAALQQGAFPEPLRKQIIDLGLRFRLLTQFTSFVAVEMVTVTRGGQPVTVQVPVEMPDGVSYEGVFGGDQLGFAPAAEMRGKAMYGLSLSGRGAGRAGAPASPAVPPPPMSAPQMGQATRVALAGTLSRDEKEDADGNGAVDLALKLREQPELKLDPALRGLAEQVENQSKEGDATIGTLRVEKFRLDVMIVLRDASAETLAALRQLGFEPSGETKAIVMVFGSIDVRKLEALSRLEAVLSVRPLAP